MSDRTHWDDCWKEHHECAVAKITALTAERDALRGLVEAAYRDGYKTGHYDSDNICYDEDGGWQTSETRRALETP